jgi:hypothetical protein
LHQLAHMVSRGDPASHGRAFQSNFAILVHNMLGADAGTALQRSFNDHELWTCWLQDRAGHAGPPVPPSPCGRQGGRSIRKECRRTS